MRYAILADIHGNLEALETAAEYLEKHGPERVVCLGDSVGYGANPNECLDWVLRHSAMHVLGNHEAAVLHEKIRWSFMGCARIAIDWTADRLRSELINGIRELPYLQVSPPATIAHGTIYRPEDFEYLMDDDAGMKSFMALATPFGFVGHSHVPFGISETGKEKDGYLREGVLKLSKGKRYLLNPGSIGQPRDGDPRLSFGIFDADELTFEIVRLPYDNKKAAAKIRAEGLPGVLAGRLL